MFVIVGHVLSQHLNRRGTAFPWSLQPFIRRVPGEQSSPRYRIGSRHPRHTAYTRGTLFISPGRFGCSINMNPITGNRGSYDDDTVRYFDCNRGYSRDYQFFHRNVVEKTQRRTTSGQYEDNGRSNNGGSGSQRGSKKARGRS